MKKRILSILLLCYMLLTLLPTAAFAADTGKAIQLGTDALSKNVNTASAPTVYFGQDHENNPAAWRVIGYNGNGVASAQGDMTLLAAGNMSSVLQFADFGTNNRYASSYLKTAIDALAEKLTTEENTAVKKRTLTSGSYNGENTDCVAGEQVDNAVFWPLSTAEAFAVNQDLRIVDPEHPSWASSYWWLRSPGYSDHDAATVNGDGSVVYSGNAIAGRVQFPIAAKPLKITVGISVRAGQTVGRRRGKFAALFHNDLNILEAITQLAAAKVKGNGLQSVRAQCAGVQDFKDGAETESRAGIRGPAAGPVAGRIRPTDHTVLPRKERSILPPRINPTPVFDISVVLIQYPVPFVALGRAVF